MLTENTGWSLDYFKQMGQKGAIDLELLATMLVQNPDKFPIEKRMEELLDGGEIE